MRWFRHATYRGVWLALLVSPVIVSGAQQASAPSPVPDVETSQHKPDEFAGVWTYNSAESVNAATGKPEQAPRSATQRGAGRGTGTSAAPVGRPRGGDGGIGGGFGSGGSGGGGSQTGQIGPTPEMMRASRDLTRDLMEIPESLTVSVSSDAVTFVDDLERKRSYSTDGRKQKYQLGASSFDARVEWKDSQLRKDIDGGLAFKMSETYFLSPDGSRLFVILRVGEVRKNVPPVGANRVYDRVTADK